MLRPRSALLIGAFLLTLGCDYGTKGLAKAHLQGQHPLEVLPGLFALRYAENTDTAFSLLGDLMSRETRHVVISVVAGAATVLLGFVLARAWSGLGTLQRYGAVAILAGAVGNASERAFRGYVIDFLHLSFWPIFNVADVAIVVGAAILWVGNWSLRQLLRRRTASPG